MYKFDICFNSWHWNWKVLFRIKKNYKIKIYYTFQQWYICLHLALLGNEINDDHEVLLPSINFVAAANAVLYSKATPHFIDVCKII